MIAINDPRRVVCHVGIVGPSRPAYWLYGGFVTQREINEHGSYAAARRAKDKEQAQ